MGECKREAGKWGTGKDTILRGDCLACGFYLLAVDNERMLPFTLFLEFWW